MKSRHYNICCEFVFEILSYSAIWWSKKGFSGWFGWERLRLPILLCWLETIMFVKSNSLQSYCTKYCPTSNSNGILNSSLFYFMGKRISLLLFWQFQIFHWDCLDNVFLLSSLECGANPPVLLSRIWPLYSVHYVSGSLHSHFNWYSTLNGKKS